MKTLGLILVVSMAISYWAAVIERKYTDWQIRRWPKYEDLKAEAYRSGEFHCKRVSLVYGEQQACMAGFMEVFARDPWSPFWKRQIEISRELRGAK